MSPCDYQLKTPRSLKELVFLIPSLRRERFIYLFFYWRKCISVSMAFFKLEFWSRPILYIFRQKLDDTWHFFYRMITLEEMVSPKI